MVNKFFPKREGFSADEVGNVIARRSGANIFLEYSSPRHNDHVERSVPRNEGYISVAVNLILDGVTNIKYVYSTQGADSVGSFGVEAIKRCHDYVMSNGGVDKAKRIFMGKSSQLELDFVA